jgi:hypothetical protein
MSYGRKFRRRTPPRLRLRRPRPYIQPGPKRPGPSGRERWFWFGLYAILIAAGVALIVLASR